MPIEPAWSAPPVPPSSGLTPQAMMQYASLPLVRGACLVLAVLLVVQIFFLGAKPGAAGLIPQPWDSVAHLAVYAVLTALLWIGTAGRMPIALFVTVVAVAALDELHQADLPGRTADVWDFLVDVTAAVGTALALLLHGVGKPRGVT